MRTEQFHLHSRMEETHWWFTGRREIARRLVRELLPPGNRHTLLDVGCGTGGNLGAFSSEYRCFGWDPSEEALRLARDRFPAAGFFGGLLLEAVGAIPSPPDLVLLMDVLEHVQEDAAFLAQVAAAVRPGGYLLLTVPAGMELWSPHDVSFGHYRRYSRAQLEHLWESQPLAPRMISYYNTRLYPVVRCVRFWTRRRGRAMGEAQTDFRLPPAPLNALLSRILSSETGVLVPLLKKERLEGYARGVSLIALLQKTEESPHGS